ncbi:MULTISPECIES: MFS transporter [Burkholderia]|uniref:MFS transporter n=1 Tax=Burkholderia cenocepacia TaxID=95486 RepID=A0AAW4TMY4_9BURK|nr:MULTISPECIES: MFS transporter [Burkholderia]MCA8383117.1 MFS transporter [Burkholderia cenocepacia]MDN7485575.1 MFS transporter [Burkholderia orbicola]
MATKETWRARLALLIAHVAGMIDLVALPVWISTLITGYHFDPQQAGSLVTLFLAGTVTASLLLAPRFNKFNGRIITTFSLALAAIAWAVATQQTRFIPMALCHAIAGFTAGTALSFTHGTIGRSVNPHRLFAMAGGAIGVFGTIFLGTVPKLVATQGREVVFFAFCGLMILASATSSLAFPRPTVDRDCVATVGVKKLSRAVWAGIFGVSLMAVTQSMVFGFFQEIGIGHGFSIDAIASVLIALGIVNLFPGPIAALLEKILNSEQVVLAGPVVQAILALVITLSSAFPLYAMAGPVFVATMVFTHTFAFGLLSRLDPSGRAVAATPAMLMTGAAIGPILGGTLIQISGYTSIGLAACVCATLAVISFSKARFILNPVVAAGE